eukprot:360885-Chlamydomonas_euryale.AAC.6
MPPPLPHPHPQEDDNLVRQFHFRRQRTELNWQQIHAVDVEDVVDNIDVKTLDLVCRCVDLIRGGRHIANRDKEG